MVNADNNPSTPTEAERKRSVRRSVWLLTAIALAFYFGFIALTWLRNNA